VTPAPPQRYLIALGSNVRHARHGAPAAVLRAAIRAIETHGLAVEAVSPTISSAPLGPSRRRYANAAAIVAGDLMPPALLLLLQRIEHDFGRVRRGQRWRARTLDLDVILWSGGVWRQAPRTAPALRIPHPEYRKRTFVLTPAAAIAPHWRDPETGRRIKHLNARLTRSTPRPR
jgi:2-amino-4-hydroxy-6-hydroxymethyldihydropteridine diphosphokinase